MDGASSPIVAAVVVRRVVVRMALDARPRTPLVGPTVPGRCRSRATRFARLDRGRLPRIASGSGYHRVETGRPPGRLTQRRHDAGAGEGWPVGGPARWPDALYAWAREPGGGRRGGAGLGRPPLAGGAAATGGRPAGGAAWRTRAGQARARGSRPDSSAGAGPARPGR